MLFFSPRMPAWQSQLSYERLLAETFPAYKLAVPWDSVNWTRYRHILVTGPQRSGTTLLAAALARHLDRVHLDEDGCRVLKDASGVGFRANGTRDVSFLRSTSERVVAQRPMLAATAHRLPLGAEDVVVFVARFCPDVFRSQNAMIVDGNPHHNNITDDATQDTGWTCKWGRTLEWASYWSQRDLRPFFTPTDPLCKIKQDVWVAHQQPILGARGLTVSYDSLHKLAAVTRAGAPASAPNHAWGSVQGKGRPLHEYKVRGQQDLVADRGTPC